MKTLDEPSTVTNTEPSEPKKNQQTGFPSPAADYLEATLDLNRHLIKRPAATFILRADSDSMLGSGINPGDLLIVDRSLTPAHRSIVVAALNGSFTMRRLLKKNNETFLRSENQKPQELKITESDDFEIWGVIAHVIKSFV